MAKIADKVFSIIDPIIIDMGYELLGIEYGVKKHQICIFYIDIDERVCDGFKHPTKNYL